MKKVGVLLINIGSPDHPTEESVRTYLAEFLSDSYVVDYPRWFWNVILNQIILRVRPAKSAALYSKIWTDAGSPLTLTTLRIAEKLDAVFPEIKIAAGMRYGNPSIANALEQLAAFDVKNLIVFPLFPQWSTTTSLTAVEAVKKQLAAGKAFDSVQVIEDYHQDSRYINSLATSIQTAWDEAGGKTAKTVFSFHGIPERYVTKKGEPYQRQCLLTAELVARELGLEAEEFIASFQSRFGPEKWLTPYTDEVLRELGEAGCQSVSVVCPGFAADCLETLEEIAVEGREIYEEAGGKNFLYVPALNDEENHIQALAGIVRNVLKG